MRNAASRLDEFEGNRRRAVQALSVIVGQQDITHALMHDAPLAISALRVVLTLHTPQDDDGVTYCGWDQRGGCGEVWPCRTVRGITAALG